MMTSEEDTNGKSNILGAELERVLNEQMQIIQEQQAQATRIIRVGLTTAGLLLTLISISASSGMLSPPEFLDLDANFEFLGFLDLSSTQLLFVIIALILMSILTFIILRLFAPALAVLSPDAADSESYKLIMNFPPFRDRKRSAREVVDDEHSEIFEDEVTLRTGVDADKAQELMGENDIEESLVEYHIGCVRGNEAIIKTNRRNLSEIYYSAAMAAFVLVTLLIYSLSVSVTLFS